MKISTKSWHYTLINVMRPGSMPKSLCQYFWAMVYSILMITTILVLGTIAVGFFPVALWSYFHNHSIVAGDVLVIMSIIAFIVSAICSIPYIYRAVTRKAKIVRESDPANFTGIVFGMVVALKSKVCPLITYEDGE